LPTTSIPRLTQRSLRHAVRTLAERDADLARSVERNGMPPLWAREPSFATLVHLILEQQVSLASALAAFERLQVALAEVTPAAFVGLDDGSLREIGFSRQKAGYAHDLALAMLDGSFDLAALETMPDDDVRRELTRLRGIGGWTADVYLTMCLLRPDVWPSGDLALATGVREVLELPARPASEELDAIAERWRPLRAVAARIVWNHYLGLRGRLET
ncbi:MAG TPA: DNA-3-methyladenine glycosylase 2 family protein, partial [Actinomycetota bacterium]|nr:DNA-3-methyladenine glycosylase 2 family protein [Actinomycetota bacterium]